MSDNLLNKLTQLKLPAMAGSLIRQRETPQTYDELSFEERLTLLVDDELLSRENSRVARLRKNAGLKYQATQEGLRYPASRGLRAEQMRELLNGHYITHRKNLLITGPTGCGKSWIANALGSHTTFFTESSVGNTLRFLIAWRITLFSDSMAFVV